MNIYALESGNYPLYDQTEGHEHPSHHNPHHSNYYQTIPNNITNSSPQFSYQWTPSTFDPSSYRSVQTAQHHAQLSPTSPTSHRTSWASLRSSSAWTSPLTSPRGGYPDSQISTFTGAMPTTMWPSMVREGYNHHGLAIRDFSMPSEYLLTAESHHQTPRAVGTKQGLQTLLIHQQYPAPQMITPHEEPPSLSTCSSPTNFSSTTPRASIDGHSRRQSHLTGLGVSALFDVVAKSYEIPYQELPEVAQQQTITTSLPQTIPIPQQQQSQPQQTLSSTLLSPPSTTITAPPFKKRRISKDHSTSTATTSKKPFLCSQCSRSFDRKCNLTTHQRSHGVEEARMVVCPKPGCGKVYTRNPDVNRHIKTAHEGARYTCTGCGRKFGRQDILNRHFPNACAGVKEGIWE